jgi:protein O-mannosyl-transferase
MSATITTPTESPFASASTRSWLLLAAVLLLTFLAYSGTLRYQFVYDDGAQIVYNPAVQSWRFAPRFFVEHVWSSQPNAPASYYRPLFMLWCLINYTVFSLKPVWWHLSTLAAHLAATGAVYALSRRLLRDPIAAAIAALVFGLHPIHVESVAWVSGVADPLMTAFFVAAFLCYLNFREQRPRRAFWMAASLALYAFAVLTKEPGIVLPLIVFAYEWMFAQEFPRQPTPERESPTQKLRRATFATVPYLLVAFAYLAQRFFVIKGLGSTRFNLPAMALPLTWPSLLWFYAHKLLWPVNLSPFYDTPYVTRPDLPHFVLPLLGLISLGAIFALWLRSLSAPRDSTSGNPRPHSVALFALVWIVAPILPVLDIVSLEPREIAHDRYLYLPCVGLALLVAMAIRRLRFTSSQLFGQPAVQVIATLALVASLGLATVRQNVYWANDLLLFYRGVRIAPTSESATNNLANALLERGYYDEGIRMHRQILQRDPGYWMSHYNLGNAYTKLGQLDQAEAAMFRAAQINPGNPQLFMYLGMIQMKNRHLPDAEHNIREAIRIWPRGTGAHFVLGLVLTQEGKLAEAAQEFRRELALDSDQPRVQAELAAVEKRLADQNK